MKNKSKKSYTDTQDSVLAWMWIYPLCFSFSRKKKLRKEYSTVISLYNSKMRWTDNKIKILYIATTILDIIFQQVN